MTGILPDYMIPDSAAGGASELTDGLERQPTKVGHSIYLARLGACRCILCVTGKECVMEIQDAKQARPHCELIAELLDSRQPKTEREHAAAREIERLRSNLAALEDEKTAYANDLQSVLTTIRYLSGD